MSYCASIARCYERPEREIIVVSQPVFRFSSNSLGIFSEFRLRSIYKIPRTLATFWGVLPNCIKCITYVTHHCGWCALGLFFLCLMTLLFTHLRNLESYFNFHIVEVEARNTTGDFRLGFPSSIPSTALVHNNTCKIMYCSETSEPTQQRQLESERAH